MYDLCPNCFCEKENEISCQKCGCRFEQSNAPVLKPMTILNNRYLIGLTLGIGGFGVTYICLDLVLKKRCAIKEFMPSQIAARFEDGQIKPNGVDDEEAYEHCKKSFLNEAKLLHRLSNNSSTVQVFDYFDENNTSYFVMELLEGTNIKGRMKKLGGKIPYEEATLMLFSIGSSLIEIHKKSILHRDISPENIFYTNFGEYKLIDFGASRFFTSEKNNSLSVLLKPGFAPPEQYSSRGIQGPWTDIYALAATYYYAVSGKMVVDTMERLNGKELIPLCEIVPEVSEDVSNSICKALELNYKNRYQNVSEFLNDMHIPFIEETQIDTDTKISEDESDKDNNINIKDIKHYFKKIFSKNKSKNTLKTPSKEDYAIITSHCKGTEGKTYRIEKSNVIIGRSADSNIVVLDEQVSRIHCIVSFNGVDFIVKDLSENGTFNMNGKRLLKNEESKLKNGECFYISSPHNWFTLDIIK